MRATPRDVAADKSIDEVWNDAVKGGEAPKSEQSEYPYIWDVYVSQSNNKNKEKESISTSSLIHAFIALSPSDDMLRVHPAVFHKQSNKGKGKGHSVRCIQRQRRSGTDDSSEGRNDGEKMISAIEVGNVDSVDKVYRLMTEHMKLGEIDQKAFECMKCYFKANASLDEGEPSQAIALYDQALAIADRRPSQPLPKGSILMKRSRAYLERASDHRLTLRTLVEDLADAVPSASTMKMLYRTASAHRALSVPIFERLASDSKVQQAKFRQIRYRHDLYEFALLHATQDGLHATRILPKNAEAWLLAGECLAELRKLKESDQYY